MTTLHDFKANLLGGEPKDLGEYAGKVVLVVNTASRCGLTPQFEGLQRLYADHADEGLVIVGVHAPEFADEVGEFCQKNYGVTFPMFDKIDVNGSGAHPLYRWLRAQKGGLLGSAIKWNFTKFLVGRDGSVIERYSPRTAPEQLERDIEAALGRDAA